MRRMTRTTCYDSARTPVSSRLSCARTNPHRPPPPESGRATSPHSSTTWHDSSTRIRSPPSSTWRSYSTRPPDCSRPARTRPWQPATTTTSTAAPNTRPGIATTARAWETAPAAHCPRCRGRGSRRMRFHVAMAVDVDPPRRSADVGERAPVPVTVRARSPATAPTQGPHDSRRTARPGPPRAAQRHGGGTARLRSCAGARLGRRDRVQDRPQRDVLHQPWTDDGVPGAARAAVVLIALKNDQRLAAVVVEPVEGHHVPTAGARRRDRAAAQQPGGDDLPRRRRGPGRQG